MSTIWDRTTEVIAGRMSILAAIVLLFVWVPGVLLNGLRFAMFGAAATGPGAGGAPWLTLLAVLVIAIGMVGHLAMVAVASDPAVSRREAVAVALRRFGPYVGLMLLVVLVGALLVVPLAVTLASGYPSMAAMQAGVPPQLSGGAATFVTLYGLLLFILFVWVEARLISVLAPVIVNERLGLRSYARAFGLTRGITWRIVGVVLLFALVAGVVILATRSVVGVALRLLLGYAGMATALFLTAAIVSLVACGLSVVIAAFTAQLYVATRNGRPMA